MKVTKKMKSAYELAMERLEKAGGPTKKLSEKQREEIAEIEKTYEAKIAETKLEFGQKVATAESMQDVDGFRQQLAERLTELEQERDKKKETIWEQAQ